MDTVLVEKLQGNVALLTINRPKSLNAINTELINDLGAALDSIAADKQIRALVVTGAGKAFVAGADISEMMDLDPAGAEAFANSAHKVFCKLDDLKVPTIAAINGFALGGGCELALCCDIRLASASAKIGQPEVGLGIVPGFGGTQRLPRVVGVANAMMLELTGKHITAEEAKRIGLVNEVYEPEKLVEAALELAGVIAQNAPIAVQKCKAAISRITDRQLAEDLAYEAKAFGECFATKDQKMAMKAFVEKQPKEEFKGE